MTAFRFGIEHEIAFLHASGEFADFTNTRFQDLDTLIARLPRFKDDYPQLRVGDAGIKVKRWYIEGFERFDDAGNVIDCPPKGVEIRTTIHDTIHGAVTELRQSFMRLSQEARDVGLHPVWLSFNPWRIEFVPDPPLTPFEMKNREASPEMRTADIPMLTYGPDLNLSHPHWDDHTLIDIGRKLTFYSPYILPFSFSSPFYNGRLWDGYSVRTWRRTGPRPAVLVFLHNPKHHIASIPSLTQPARVPAEAGRIEFKAFDTCRDFNLYAALLALLKGIALDNTLAGRATTPDQALHQRVARLGFDDPAIAERTNHILNAARLALGNDPDVAYLTLLEDMLARRWTPAHEQIRIYRETGSLAHTLMRLRYAGTHALC